MRTEDLVGIAAPQIGESIRMIVSEIRETEHVKDPTIHYASTLTR